MRRTRGPSRSTLPVSSIAPMWHRGPRNPRERAGVRGPRPFPRVASPSADAAGPFDRRAKRGFDPRFLLGAEIVIGVDSGQRLFEAVGGARRGRAPRADHHLGLLLVVAGAFVDDL